MGIRIQVVAGYALTDVMSVGGIITDPRINSYSPLLDPGLVSPTLDEHKQWLDERPEPDKAGAKRVRFLLGDRDDVLLDELSDSITYEPEYGLSNVLVITPPYEMDKLVRSDDPIDYVMETLGDFNGDPAVVNLPKGVGFHYGELMDRRTGVQVCADSSRLISSITEFPKLAEYYDLEGLPLWATGDAAMTPLYRSCAEAVENVVPLVPASIRLVAEHCELFADPDVWKTLRPVVYTFWS